MNALLNLTWPMPDFVVERLGWVLVHSMWQFALLASLAGVIVRAMPNRSAAARYGFLVIALGLSVVAPVVTWIVLSNDTPSPAIVQTPVVEEEPPTPVLTPELPALAIDPSPPAGDFVMESLLPDPPFPTAATNPLPANPLPASPLSASPSPAEPLVVTAVEPPMLSWSEWMAEFLQPWLAWIVAGWCMGIVLCSTRPLLGWYTLRRLRRVGVSPVPGEMLVTLRRVADRLGMPHATRVLQSTLVTVPVVVGYFRPVILLPVSLVTSIPTGQLEAILAHELAHVRRHDFLVNLLQRLVETLCFYHPAVWWLSSRIRLERENCCDDLVVDLLGNRAEYGRALLAIEELRGRSSVLALGAVGGTLLSRVRRIIGLPAPTSDASRWSAMGLAVCGMVALCVASLLSWHSLTEADAQTLAPPNAEASDAEPPNAQPKRKLSEIAARNAEMEKLRETGRAALERGDYAAMAATFAKLSQAPDAFYGDAVWHGHSQHIVGKWKEAGAAFLRAIELADARLKTLDQLTGPEYEQVIESENEVKGSPVRDWQQERDRERERIQADWPMLVQLAGRVQWMQLDDAGGAVKTLSRGLRFAPEAESLEQLTAAATAALETPPARPHPLWFKLMMPIATHRELALAYEKFGNMQAAADCLTRVHLCHLAYEVGMAHVDADHLVDIVSRVPAEKRRPWHELVIKHPGTLRAPKPQAFDYQEQLTQDERNPFRVEATLDGFQMTRLGPSRASLAKLPDGRWIMAYTGGDEFQARVLLSTSVDGKTWSEPWEFAHNNVFPTRNPSLVVDDDGVLWMLCGSKRFDLQQFSTGQYRLWLCSSRDGRTWSDLRPIKTSFHFTGQYQQTAQLTRDRQGRFWVISPKEIGSADSLADLRELQPLKLAEVDSKRFIEDMHATFDEDNRCHLLFGARGNFHTSSPNMVDWTPAEQIGGAPNPAVHHPQSFIEGNRIFAIYEDNRGWLRPGTIDGHRVAWSDPVRIGLPLGGSLLARHADQVLLPTGPIGNGAAPVVLTAAIKTLVNLAKPFERVIEKVEDKAILFEDGSVITTDAGTKNARLTTDGEKPAKRTELKAGIRVRYELAPGKAATKVLILPAKQDDEQQADDEQQPADDTQQQAAAAQPALRITGRVLDAETGQPIAKCRMVPTPVYRDDATDVTWQTQYMKEFTDGQYVYETERPWRKTKLRIEADGYRPATTRVVNKGESVELDVKLVREIFAGVVRLPSGQPAAKAQVALASWTNEVTVDSSKLSYSGHGAKLRQIVKTDEQGRFVMPAEVDPWVVVVAQKAGYAEVASASQSLARKSPVGQDVADEKPKEDTAVIELKPWGRVEGRVLMGDKPLVGAKYFVYQARTDNVFVRSHYYVETDAEGRFIVEQIPPGQHGICQRYVEGSDGTSRHSIDRLLVRFEIPAGKTTSLQLGDPGRTLSGKLALPAGFPHKVDWSKVKLRVLLQPPRFSRRFGGNDESQQVWSKFAHTEEAKQYSRESVAIADDGSFRIVGLPAAEYQLTVSADGEAMLGDPQPNGEVLRGSEKFSVPAVVPADATEAIDLGTIKLTSLVALNNAAAAPATEASAVPAWGPTTNGLRARVVPVLGSMSEDAIDLAQRIDKFAQPVDVAFAVEMENVTDKPIALLDTRYGTSFGASSGKANSDWYAQFLFSIDLYDGDGKLTERPEVEVVTRDMILGSVSVATVEPGKTHRFLLRPSKWLSLFQQRFEPGSYRAAVRYHGMPPRVVTRIKEYKPESPVFAAVAGDIVTPPIAFEVSLQPVAADSPKEAEPPAKEQTELVWGEPTNGLRAALSFAPVQATHAHGEKLELNMHVENVGDQPITVASQLWMSDLAAQVKDAKGEPVQVGGTSYTGLTPVVRVTLKPRHFAVFGAGNIGLAITGERAANFEHITNRTLVAPAGKYTVQLAERFGKSFLMKDGKGKVLAPLPGDFVGEVKTGEAPLTITNETIPCSIIDAVTGKPVTGTTVNFRFIKPKSGDEPEEIVDDVFWGPQAPSSIYFYIPDKVLGRADRDEIEVAWGVCGHAGYEPYGPEERIPLKPFFHEGTTAARETLGTIKLTPKKRVAAGDGIRVLPKPELLFPDHWNVMAVGFDNDGKELVTASTQGFVTIRRWDIVGKKLISEIKLEGDKPGREFREETLTLSEDRRRVIAATDEYVGIWETATGKLLTKLPIPKVGDNDTIRMLSCTPDFSVIAGNLDSNFDRTARFYDAHTVVWDGNSGKLLRTLTHERQASLIAISLAADGTRFATTNGGGTKIWETSTGQELLHVPNDNAGRKHSNPETTSPYANHVWSLQFSPNGRQLAIGDILGVKLVETASGKLLQHLEGTYSFSTRWNTNLVFSKDGQLLARLGTGDKVNGKSTGYLVPIWSTQTGQKRFELQTVANGGAFSDDSQLFAVGFSDRHLGLSVWPLNGDVPKQTAGPRPTSPQDKVEENGHYRGQKAAEFIDKFKPTWGDTTLGLQYGIALTKPKRQFRSGERVPLVVFFRNVSDKPIKFDMRPDFFRNTPKVLNAKGAAIPIERLILLGADPHYVEKLEPGEAVGPFYLNFGLGENPRPGRQHWHPFFKSPAPGTYKLTHAVSINVADQKDGERSKRGDIATGTIAFEIVERGKPIQGSNQPASKSTSAATGGSKREFKTEFRFDDQGRLYSKQQGGVPGRIGTADVHQQIQVGSFDGQAVTILRGPEEFNWAYHGPDKNRIPREVDPRDYLFRYWNEPLSQRLAQKKYHIAGVERWRDQDVIVIESDPSVKAEEKLSYQGRLSVCPAFDYAVVVRTARIRFDDLGREWHEYSRQETFNYEQDETTGLWFPRNGTYTSLNPTHEQAAKKEAAPLAWKKETTFTLWKPNPEFTDADFTLEIPEGVFVMKEPIPEPP